MLHRSCWVSSVSRFPRARGSRRGLAGRSGPRAAPRPQPDASDRNRVDTSEPANHLDIHNEGAMRPYGYEIDLLALLCVEPALEGGETILVSAHAVMDVLRREHPAHLDRLRRPFAFERAQVTQPRTGACLVGAGVRGGRWTVACPLQPPAHRDRTRAHRCRADPRRRGRARRAGRDPCPTRPPIPPRTGAGRMSRGRQSSRPAWAIGVCRRPWRRPATLPRSGAAREARGSAAIRRRTTVDRKTTTRSAMGWRAARSGCPPRAGELDQVKLRTPLRPLEVAGVA
jgi:Taurine catabolism dioxygenase TauD, TfdA family